MQHGAGSLGLTTGQQHRTGDGPGLRKVEVGRVHASQRIQGFVQQRQGHVDTPGALQCFDAVPARLGGQRELFDVQQFELDRLALIDRGGRLQPGQFFDPHLQMHGRVAAFAQQLPRPRQQRQRAAPERGFEPHRDDAAARAHTELGSHFVGR